MPRKTENRKGIRKDIYFPPSLFERIEQDRLTRTVELGANSTRKDRKRKSVMTFTRWVHDACERQLAMRRK